MKGEKTMLCHDPGVLPDSDYYFSTASMLAKELFYYALCVGSFRCGPGYHVKRKRYNSLLLMYLSEGSCTVCSGEKKQIARAGDVVVLDCYRPHEYYTDTALAFSWVHFDGSQSLEFARSIQKSRGMVFPCDDAELLKYSFEQLLTLFQTEPNVPEPAVSCILHRLLCELAAPAAAGAAQDDGILGAAVAYIRQNYAQLLTVEKLSRLVGMSPSQCSRRFRAQTGYAPYEYVTKVRVAQAQRLLKSTRLSVEEIAEKTGFGSASNFIHAFREKVGISPGQFRNTPF
jgi:AraC family transcriptional regulator